MTIEASIVLPLLIFMMFLLIFPLKVMEAERKLQNTMEITGKRLALAEYVQTIGEQALSDSSYSEVIANVTDGLEEGTALAVILAEAAGGPFVNTYFSEDTAVFSTDEGKNKAMFYAELKYDVDMPFLAYRLTPVSKSLVVNRRAWVGASGGRGRSKYGIDPDEEEEDRIVYLGKTSSQVYHDDPKCHYLSNNMTAIDASAIADLRNSSNGKYHACSSCKPGKSGTVFYFESGSSYHSSMDCKAITSYSRAVHLSELDGMHACSYCGKSK